MMGQKFEESRGDSKQQKNKAPQEYVNFFCS